MSNHEDKQVKKLRLQIGSWCFAPTLKLTITTAILFIILVYLGIWQIGRACYKKNIFQSIQAKTQASPVELITIKDPTLEKDRFTAVSFEGVFLNNFNILIDNQMLDHKVGYRVLTPVHSPLLDKWVLVDRGWIPAGPDRKQLPNIGVIFGFKDVTGIINTISTGIALVNDKVVEDPHWPLVLQQLDYDLIAAQLKHPVFAFVVQLPQKHPHSFTYPPLDFGISSDKHWGYAFQWFILAFILLMYYVIFSTKRSK